MPPSVNTKPKRARSRRARGSINATGILVGAFDFCRETPVDQLSMPRLAAFLDVGVTSIYWYYKSKQELLDAMTQEALASFYESMPELRGENWEDMLREFFASCYTLLAADDLKCDLIARRVGGPNYQGTVAAWPRAAELLAGLRAAGFPSSLAWHAFFTLSTYTRGFLLADRTAESAGDPAPARLGRATAGPDSAAGSVVSNPGGAALAFPPEEFAFGVTNIILGLRVLLPERAGEGSEAGRDRDVA